MAKSKAKSVKKKTGFNKKEFSIFMIVFAAVGAFTLWVSFAAPHKSFPYTLSISPAGPYTFNETVYTTTTAPQVSGSYIGLSCYVNGTLVMSGTHANFSTGWYFNYPWILGPTQSYGGGPSDCTFTAFHLSHNKVVNDAQTSFHIDG